MQGVLESNESLDRELAEIREELDQERDRIRALFNYYSMITGPARECMAARARVTREQSSARCVSTVA